MLRHTLIAASLGLAAEAFIIPSTLSLPDLKFATEGHNSGALGSPGDMAERFKNLHMGFKVQAQVVEYEDGPITVALACGGCANAIPDINTIHSNDPTFLKLEIDTSPDGKSLDMNSIPIFPIRGQPETVSALAMTKGSGYQQEGRLEYIAGAYIADSEGLPESQLVDLYIQITSFDNNPVDVEAFSIRMLRDNTDRYHLSQVIVRSSGQASNRFHSPHDTKAAHESALDRKVDTECSALTGLASNLCRLRVKLNEQVSSWQFKQPSFFKHHSSRKPCGSRVNRPGDLEGIRRLPLRGGPAKYAGKFHGGRFESHHQKGRFMHVAATTASFVFWDILVPVVIGAVACVTASLLGMIVGTLIAATWLKVVRGGKRGNVSSRHQANETAASVDEDSVIGESEKEGLLEQAPTYEESEGLPKYVEKE